MSKKEIVLWLVFADFVAFTAWTIFAEGFTTFVPVAIAFAQGSLWGAQILVDFLLAVVIALGFVVADARQKGIAAWPWVVATCSLGSIGLLAYLIRRERAAVVTSPRSPAPSTRATAPASPA